MSNVRPARRVYTTLKAKAKAGPIGGLCPVRGSLLAPVGSLSEIVRVPGSRVIRRHVAERRIRGGAADRRTRLARSSLDASSSAHASGGKSKAATLTRSSHKSKPQLSRSRQRRRSREKRPPRAHPCRAAVTPARPRSFQAGASSARTAPPNEGSPFALGEGPAATRAGLSHAG